MLVVFSLIFAVDTKIIFGYNFETPLIYTNYEFHDMVSVATYAEDTP